MNITKTTLKFSVRRSMNVTHHVIENYDNLVCIWSGNDDNIPVCIYKVNSDETLSFLCLFQKHKHMQEHLPSQIKNEKFLRTVIHYISNNI